MYQNFTVPVALQHRNWGEELLNSKPPLTRPVFDSAFRQKSVLTHAWLQGANFCYCNHLSNLHSTWEMYLLSYYFTLINKEFCYIIYFESEPVNHNVCSSNLCSLSQMSLHRKRHQITTNQPNQNNIQWQTVYDAIIIHYKCTHSVCYCPTSADVHCWHCHRCHELATNQLSIKGLPHQSSKLYYLFWACLHYII